MTAAVLATPCTPALFTPAVLAAAAVDALVAEACLEPKPGLVDGRGAGSHTDMTLDLLLASARSLRPTFAALAEAATGRRIDARLRTDLAAIGRAGERAMEAATGGVNTHRGAIWSLGLTVAAAAATGPGPAEQLTSTAAAIARFPDAGAAAVDRPAGRPGARARARYGVTGALGEAGAGFPHALRALRVLRDRRTRAVAEADARLDALLISMTSLEDTCLLHRGGPAGLALGRRGARRVLARGGVETRAGRSALRQLDLDLRARRLSPGGSADVLAHALLLDPLTH